MKIDVKELEELVAQKLVYKQKHPSADLYIYNYSPIVQYSKAWNPLIKQCRGLILDGEGNIHSRPLKKFFNVEEVEPHEIPNEPFEVMSKEDGSLGIIYWKDEMAFIATRGSFTSEQALKATQMLHTTYRNAWKELLDAKYMGYTPLFEIIFPSNRIVVNYGNKEQLILLGYKYNHDDTTFGHCKSEHFPVVKYYDGIKDINELKALEEPNKEGFVIRFKSGFMVKCKFAEYVRLHRIVTNVSNRSIWEYLKNCQPFDEILEKVPDEFFSFVKKTKQELEDHYAEIEQQAWRAYKDYEQQGITNDRKTFAMEVIKNYKPISGILFAILDNKKYDHIIWKMAEPEYAKPFKIEVE